MILSDLEKLVSRAQILSIVDAMDRPVGRASTLTPPKPPVPLVAGDRVSARTLGDVHPSNRGTQTVPPGAFPRPHELATGERLARAGISAEWRVEDSTHGVKNPDVTIDGHAWDFKSPEGAGKTTISNQFARAKEQGVHRSCSTSRVAQSTKRPPSLRLAVASPGTTGSPM